MEVISSFQKLMNMWLQFITKTFVYEEAPKLTNQNGISLLPAQWGDHQYLNLLHAEAIVPNMDAIY